MHVLFGSRDVYAGERILSAAAPARPQLVALYRALSSLYRSGGPISLDDEGIAREARALEPRVALDAPEVASGLAVFSELGFASVAGWGDARRVSMAASPERMELSQSACYAEGLRAQRAFSEFCTWALEATPDELLARVSRPITPDFGIIV